MSLAFGLTVNTVDGRVQFQIFPADGLHICEDTGCASTQYLGSGRVIMFKCQSPNAQLGGN